MINIRTSIEAVSAPTVAVILHILVMFFIVFPINDVDIGFITTVTSISLLLPLYWVEVYFFRTFFIWLWKTVDNRSTK